MKLLFLYYGFLSGSGMITYISSHDNLLYIFSNSRIFFAIIF